MSGAEAIRVAVVGAGHMGSLHARQVSAAGASGRGVVLAGGE